MFSTFVSVWFSPLIQHNRQPQISVLITTSIYFFSLLGLWDDWVSVASNVDWTPVCPMCLSFYNQQLPIIFFSWQVVDEQED